MAPVTDLEIELLDEFTAHMMGNRKPVIERYLPTAST